MTTAEVLRNFVFFSNFDSALLNRMAESAPRVNFPAGQVVFCEGEVSQAMYLILSGEVSIQRRDDQGGAINLGMLKANDMFGELGLFTGEKRMATVTTATPCEFLVIDRSLLLKKLEDASPETILNAFAALSEEIRAKNEENFHELLAKRVLEAQIEAERQRALTQLVAGVAHELNTPLGVVMTATSILERDLANPAFDALRTDPKSRRLLESMTEAMRLITGNINRAHKLVQDFKKVAVSQLVDTREIVILPETISETLNLASPILKRAHLEVEIRDQLPAEVRAWNGYCGYLSQILLNLLSNIERYAYPNNSGGKVEIMLAFEGKNYIFSVKDFGKGISKEDQARVFDPFFTTGRSIGGTGLGMTIVYNLVTQALKGSIQIISESGQGTEVRITFPRDL